MKPDEQRIAIARWHGTLDRWAIVKRGLYYRPGAHGYTNRLEEAWILPEVEADKHVYARGEEPVSKIQVPPPDYLADLNAMREAEEKLPYELLADYTSQLARMAQAHHPQSESSFHKRYVCATAAQRAEALLRTLGLWRDNEKEQQ